MSRFATVLTLIAAVTALAGCAGEPETGSATGLIAPESYRASIEAVEAVLYQPAPPDFGDPERAAAAVMDLYDAILERETDRRVRDAAATLIFTASRADISDAGYAAPDLGPLRERWEEVRADLFGEADWFRSTTAGVAAARTPEPPTVDPADRQALERVIDRLGRLIDRGRRECADLGEPSYEPGMEGWEGRQQIDAWNRFHRDWDESVTDAARRMPPRPPLDGVMAFVSAYQDVERAVAELRHVPSGTGVWPTPFEYQWTGRLDTARRHLEAARASLSTPR